MSGGVSMVVWSSARTILESGSLPDSCLFFFCVQSREFTLVLNIKHSMKKQGKAISIKFAHKTLTDLPVDVVQLCLSFASVSTLIRATMSCHVLKEAAMAVARERAEAMGLAEEKADSDDEVADSDDEVEAVTAKGPLPKLFKAELQRFHRKVDPADLEGGDFLYFRATEGDLCGAVDDDDPVPMLLYTTDSVAWLQEDMGILDEKDLDEVRKEVYHSWWESTYSDYFAYTRHLSLHPRYGRPTLSVSALLEADPLARICVHGDQLPMRPLHQWITEAPRSERLALEADAKAGDDAITVLFRFALDERGELCYRGSRRPHLSRLTVGLLISQVPVPKWQRRPFPFDARMHSNLLNCMMDDCRTLHNPFGGSQTMYYHMSVGDHDGCWFRASLAFYDALEALAKK